MSSCGSDQQNTAIEGTEGVVAEAKQDEDDVDDIQYIKAVQLQIAKHKYGDGGLTKQNYDHEKDRPLSQILAHASEIHAKEVPPVTCSRNSASVPDFSGWRALDARSWPYGCLRLRERSSASMLYSLGSCSPRIDQDWSEFPCPFVRATRRVPFAELCFPRGDHNPLNRSSPFFRTRVHSTTTSFSPSKVEQAS